jgi:signal transduction histidine kinase
MGVVSASGVPARLRRRWSVREAVPRPWWWDAGIATLVLAVGVVSLTVLPVRLAMDVPPAATGVRFALVVVLALLETARTRRPGTALAVAGPLALVDVAAGFSPTAALVVADLLYCAILHGGPRVSRRARLAAPSLWVVGLTWLAVVGAGPDVLIAAALSGAAVLLLPAWWAWEVRVPVDRAAAERADAAQAARIAELDRRAAVADERARIARELHDSVAGHLSAIALQSQAALRTEDDTARERVLGSVRENSVRALEEMRALIGVLRRPGGPAGTTGAAGAPEDRTTAPRLADLPALVESARAGGLVVDATLTTSDGVPGPVDLTAYRIVQEALTNVSAHAPGGRVRVAMDRPRGDELALEIVNTVPGPPGPGAPVGAGSGLAGMRVRAEAVGGHLDAGPTDEGWRVAARLPLDGFGVTG